MCRGGTEQCAAALESDATQHHLDSEAHDGDGGGVGETAARVATVHDEGGYDEMDDAIAQHDILAIVVL